ncbi:MAG: PEP-CTERM sorting domain-containing protein [Phycisphaerae bacterium]|nr:PEP-CTERM sorting domain-containing protein [Phycisphaerae bacterium]
MKTRFVITGLAVLAAASLANAAIIDASCTDDGDGAVTMGAWDWTWDAGTETATMTVPETQHWGPAHIFPEFFADSEVDPYAWVIKEVENDTTFVWTDYHINITLNNTFTIVEAAGPAGWLTPVITQPTQVGSEWIGSVDYYYGGSGTEILIGGIGDFSAKMQFAGSASFCFEQIPTPEPASLGLLVMGGLALLRRR